MIERGERARSQSLGARAALELRLWITTLWSEAAIGSIDLARAGLATIAIALQSFVLMSPGHFRPAGNAFFALFVVTGTLTSLALSVFIALPLQRFTTVRLRQGIAALALLLVGILTVFGVQRAASGIHAYIDGKPYNNDGAVMDYYAAQQVLRGHNPYVSTNIVPALASLNVPATTTTPLMRGQFRGMSTYPSEAAVEQAFMNVLQHRWHSGVPIPPEFESKYNYPSGSFLFILPFVWAGIHDLRFLYVLFLLLIGGYLWYRMPRPLRPFVPFLLLADLPLVTLTAGGQPDTMYGFFLLLALAEWTSPVVSPLALGVSVATKQLSWFFLPFYLILVVREFGMREALKRSGIVSAIFLLLNGPFILRSPESYLTSLAGPMTDPMFPLGIGIIALFVSNLVHMVPKYAFTITEMLAWIGGVVAFARWRILAPAAIAALGAFPLFFAWRSLVNYFYLVPLVALAVALASAAQRQRLGKLT